MNFSLSDEHLDWLCTITDNHFCSSYLFFFFLCYMTDFTSTLSQTSHCLQYKSFQNTVGKGEIARYEQFLLFQQSFLPIRELSTIFLSNLKLSSANSFSLEYSKICRLGNELKCSVASSLFTFDRYCCLKQSICSNRWENQIPYVDGVVLDQIAHNAKSDLVLEIFFPSRISVFDKMLLYFILKSQ